MRLVAEPLRADAFAPYGEVLEAPGQPGRTYFVDSLGNGRPGTPPSLSIARVPQLAALPLVVTRMERHEFSSQTFVPLDVARWLVIVAPQAAEGGPDRERARAFLASAGQGVTYRTNTWHHPMTVLDRPAQFAIFMWRDGTVADEEFVTIDRPFTVVVAEGAGG
jgi:ureidoglycolate lyase